MGFVGYYSYRAVQRMSAEREEYEEYLVKLGHVDDAAEPAVKVLGVDFGTSSLRCAISSPPPDQSEGCSRSSAIWSALSKLAGLCAPLCSPGLASGGGTSSRCVSLPDLRSS